MVDLGNYFELISRHDRRGDDLAISGQAQYRELRLWQEFKSRLLL